ncbi:amidohydrolase family protein [Aquirufa sp. ROCK-SH2]
MNSEEDPQDHLTKNQQKYRRGFPGVYTSFIITRENRYTEQQLDSLFTGVKKQGYHFIKLFSVADESTFLNIMKKADQHQMIVAGHFPSNVAMETVLKTSFKSIEHLGGYIQTINLKNVDHWVGLSKGVFNCPTLNYFLKVAKVDSSYQTKLELVFNKLVENKSPLLVGSDLGGLTGMLEEMKIWEKWGVTNDIILKSATYHPALFFNESANWGSIQVGIEASFLLLDKNPLESIDHLKSIRKIILRGNEM